MNATIDINKVKAAVARYAPDRIDIKPTTKDKTPVDAALRKPLRGRSVACRSGFQHPHFLNGGGL